MNVLIGVCVGSWDKLQMYVEPHGTYGILALYRQRSIAEAYNLMLAASQESGVDVLILQHDDLEVLDPDGQARLAEAVSQPGVALAGVAGGGGEGGLAWWNQNPIGHQRTDAMMIDFGTRTGDVQALEGSIMALSRWSIEHLRFDTQLPGFHGYDVDISRTAWRMGKRVVVVDVDTHHHNRMGFKSEQSHAEWLKADEIYQRKWGTG